MNKIPVNILSDGIDLIEKEIKDRKTKTKSTWRD